MAIRPRGVALFKQLNVPCAVVCYFSPNVGPWRSPARIGGRPRTKGTGHSWDGGGDKSQAVRKAGEQGRRLTFQAAEPKRTPTAQSRKLNENTGFTNSCGEPYKVAGLRNRNPCGGLRAAASWALLKA